MTSLDDARVGSQHHTTGVVHLQDVRVTFPGGGTTGPVSFTVEPGERVLIMGPSGGGKSTVVHRVIGAIPHAIHATAHGHVCVAGRDMADQEPSDIAGIAAVVGQDPWASVCFTRVEDDIAFPLENAAVPPQQIGERVRAAAALAGVGHLLGRATSQLSGGELQRVALAVALVSTPQVIVLDEPTSMLDHHGIADVTRAIDHVQEHTGAAVIMVEHRVDDIATTSGSGALPDRWIVLDEHGAIQWDGKAGDIGAPTAAMLLAQGCWLPTDVELLALFGYHGGISNPAVQRGIRAAAEVTVTPVVGVAPDQPRTALLAENLSVAPPPRHRSTPRTPVLADINLAFSTGELTAIVGTNGTGKTTLLRTLAGVETPVSGVVRGPRGGLVCQNPEHQFMAHSVRAEVGYQQPVGCEARVEELLAQFELTDVADRSPFSLSGGQKRRLSLAAMLAHDHPFLCADEPTFGLDRRGVSTVLGSLRDHAASGHGVVWSCHDMRAVAVFADRVVAVTKGRVLSDLTPWEFFSDAALVAVAGLAVPPLVGWAASAAGCAEEFRHLLGTVDALARTRAHDSVEVAV
ncbi:ABC transporter ATP-binding protein [Jonesia denitrificans]|uniref:ABC transporter related n=1 Tax=Jonesia denitrificans (strain ATCC 14870 / DSM 20603 / BCRC 15368 / CIP 55.134 / JCM 11481 / NBRC 15587 / NCTC 10816 / Prevot 55134) TaxID=471856 RepID=C7R588_JONDD|nr:ABC transporter ATP-binding protein [Jonesia denitrificans]ACV07766.1 ABC transporter related [Jonesia denitrificans DSM 20603]ASE08514.1 ABC transporter ATP-binding protein [Jonesia denitrificans]QXB43122.1 energy-coupling factor ABC transporter ATP-binding protein [Jonesia denitrificans]SQH19738.1 Putative HMP/thiamine import ATP-binding protein YkoD [Jonesia denitrificans]